MRFWLIIALFMPCAAEAKDVHIYVSYVVKQERVSPSPKIVTPRIEYHFMLREDGTVQENMHTAGNFPENHTNASRLGEGVKVIDSHTIKRTWKVGAQIRELTVTTNGTTCDAVAEIKNGAGEFRSFSSELNTTGLYRNSSVVKTDCKIE